jgi:hypothetical protein
MIQYLHKDSVTNKGLDVLWNKCVALDPKTVASLLYSDYVVNFLRRVLKKKYKMKFSDEEISDSINKIIHEPIELEEIKQVKIRKEKRKHDNISATDSTLQQSVVASADSNEANNQSATV